MNAKKTAAVSAGVSGFTAVLFQILDLVSMFRSVF